MLRAGGGPSRRHYVLRSFDGSGWQTHEWLPHGSGGFEVEVAGDDTVWVGSGYGGDPFPEGYIGRLDPKGWRTFEKEEGHLSLLEDGSAVHVTTSDNELTPGHVRLLVRRFDGGAWHDWRTAILDEDPWSDIGQCTAGQPATVGPDGTVWAVANPLKRSNSRWPAYSTHVVRIDADGVREWHPDDGVPDIYLGPLYVSPDGSLWSTWSDKEDIEGVPAAHDNGVARFDGATWGHFLLGHSVLDMDIGPDGSVWVLTQHREERDSVSLHVITPEAVAAAEQ